MILEDFIEELYKAGWTAFGDAQHKNIAELHKKLFPEIARLINSVYLNIDKPSKWEKAQYSKAIIALEKARHEFDLINDLKACRIAKINLQE